MDITTLKFEFWCEEHQTHLQPTEDARVEPSSWRDGDLVAVTQVWKDKVQVTNTFEFDLSGMDCPTGDYAYAVDDCVKSWKVRTVE